MHRRFPHRIESTMEYSDGHSDYRTAHTGAGDGDYTRFLPGTCAACAHILVEVQETETDKAATPEQIQEALAERLAMEGLSNG